MVPDEKKLGDGRACWLKTKTKLQHLWIQATQQHPRFPDPPDHSRATSLSDDEDGDEEIYGAHVISDSVKIEEEEDALTDIEETDAWEGIDNEELCQQLVDLSVCLNDDQSDMTWMPSRTRQ